MSENPSENFYCRDPKWTDVLIFFLANIIAHAATLPPSPGNSTAKNIEMALISLILPYFGVARAASIIRRGAIWEENPLQRAARAGALCVVGKDRTKLGKRPRGGVGYRTNQNYFSHIFSEGYFRWRNSRFKNDFLWECDLRKVHGQKQLTEGYLIYPLERFEVEEFSQGPQSSLVVELPCNHSFVKPLVSIFQIFYASIAIYRDKGDQITHYGYGAYSFIAIPYIFMSFMNLAAAISCPEYPCLFLVESEVMEEARGKDCFFNGTVGRVKPAPQAGEPVATTGSNEIATSTEDTTDHDIDSTSEQEEGNDGPESLEPTQWEGKYDWIMRKSIGRLCPHQPSLSEKISRIVALLLTCIVIAGPFIVVGVLSRFRSEQSNFSQRAWLVVWIPVNFLSIVMGILPVFNRRCYFGWALRVTVEALIETRDDIWFVIIVGITSTLVWILIVLPPTAPAIWVFWAAGKSIMENMVCETI